MTLNARFILKCAFTDGTLDVRTFWLYDSTIRIDVARGVEGLALPLPPCGQLTRCFSVVAELLVDLIVANVGLRM